MPSLSSKGKSKNPSRPSAAPRSRNTTPLPPSNVRASVEPASSSTAYFRTNMAALSKDCDVSLEELLDRGGSVSQIPSVASLNGMRETIQRKVLEHVRIRGEVSDRVLRELQKSRSQRTAHDRERERERAADKEAEDRKHKLKKISRKREPDELRPLAVGAHGVARQDGIDVHKDNSSTISSPISQAPPSATGTGPADAPSPSISEASHQPAPAPAVPQFQTFGPDPSKFDDPTIYHIRDVTPGMTEDEIKEIYCVAEYPPSDLHDRTAGIPPDKDFSNAKPASQVNASVFANYVEPYIRSLTEEDVAFLKERGDRIAPFVLPRRGLRHYKEIWADEDGNMNLDSNDNHLPPNEPRGTFENMSEDLVETEEISAGPLVSRLLSTLRPEGRGNANNSIETNGVSGDAMDIDEGPGSLPTDANSSSLPAASQLPEFQQLGWKAPPVAGKTDYASLDDRVLLELRHFGLIAEEDEASYEYHYDDEVAARLRFLQAELRKQSVVNGARKQRLLELTEERMAQQEYNTIADDLDNQLNTAYLKRNRNMGKGKKQTKRPGGAGGGSHPVPNAGISRPSVGEPIRTLMERKSLWNNTIGPVVNYGKTGLPTDTIFPEDKMKMLEEREVEMWNEGEE
ncbi:histone acetyltransferases subunit 3-domain-containing protein [Clohesyomyces aquaticus]|uniref:Histone acetyltransferases subunit 3-domain-containing protein n=1 Tax=Clohesyomyces aquaticus TaxID=1231657 RepID=A0A1Y1ZZY4_9PLEO|nr:histone acetyltransferases subunit 3-domain-containing protein [Clohesyomyces aquaticus]